MAMADSDIDFALIAKERMVLNFDRRPRGGTIPNGYKGFDWGHFSLEELGGDRVARNDWAQGSSFSLPNGSFDVQSLNVTPLSSTVHTIEIIGVADGEIVETKTVRVDMNVEKFVRLNWEGIDTVYFNANTKSGVPRFTEVFVLDDVVLKNVVTDAPVSSTMQAVGSDVFGDDRSSLSGLMSAGSIHGEALPLAHLV